MKTVNRCLACVTGGVSMGVLFWQWSHEESGYKSLCMAALPPREVPWAQESHQLCRLTDVVLWCGPLSE